MEDKEKTESVKEIVQIVQDLDQGDIDFLKNTANTLAIRKQYKDTKNFSLSNV